MSKVRVLMKQTVLVEFDENVIQESGNYMDAINNGAVEIIELVDIKFLTEDGMPILIDKGTLDQVKNECIGDVKEILEG